MSKQVDKQLKDKAVKLLDAIASGADEQTACNSVGISRGKFLKWLVEYPEFEAAVDTAKELRADTYKSKVSQMVMDESGNVRHYEKDEVPSVKTSFEMLKWLAEVDNPEKYGKRIKHEGNVGATQIIIDTGIKPKHDVVETSDVDETELL